MYALVAAESLIVLVLLAALLYGAPASVAADRQQITAQSTEVARLRATVATIPTATPTRNMCLPYFYFC